MRKILFFIVILLLSVSFNLNVFGYYSGYIGKEVSLAAPSAYGVVYVGVDKKNFNRITSNLIGSDAKGYYNLILDAKGFEVSNFTRALILDVSYSDHAVQVEILEGAYAGRVGWVLLNCAF